MLQFVIVHRLVLSLINSTQTLRKRPHSFATILETPDRSLRSAKTGVSGVVRSFRFWLRWCLPESGWDILTRGPEAAPEVTPESPDFVQTRVSGVGRPESPVLLGENWFGSVRR